MMCAAVITENEPLDESLGEAVSSKVLAGKRALVTGGSRGIGRATALALAAGRRGGGNQLSTLGGSSRRGLPSRGQVWRSDQYL